MSQSTEYLASLIKSNVSKRLLNLYFPREDGPSAGLLVTRLVAEEEISRDFCYTVTCVSDDPAIALKDVQCRMVCVELLREDASSRWFNGYCHSFQRLEVNNHFAQYVMVLRPWLAYLRLRSDYWLFHNQTIEEQTKEVFCDLGLSSYDLRIRESDPPRTFSCQFDETDYNYLHRRWEEMGWHYSYEHTDSGHRLILSSTSTTCEPVDGDTTIAWHHDAGSNKHDKISHWQPVRSVVSGKVGISHFDFKKPVPARSGETSNHEQGDIHPIEVYQYLGLYGAKNDAHAKAIAKRRMEQIDGPGKLFEGEGDCRRMQPGRWFRLTQDHASQAYGDDGNAEFLILQVRHIVESNLLDPDKSRAEYTNQFRCIRRMIPWRPEPGFNSSPTLAPGVDTATVVGPKGDEIHTDKYGRIKVQFHWDREGKNDENSSCWLRVMTPWANKNFGMIALPRIATEVVVQYLQGNPDRPVVVGQFYNERHMPPWELPAHQTQSGMLTRSSKGGSPANANALRFEDKKGAEEIWVHAERDMRTEVEHNDSQTVGAERTITVGANHTETITKNMTLTVKENLTETVKKDMSTHVLEGKQDNTVKGDISITSESGAISITAKTQITLTVGGSSITMTPGDITALAGKIFLNH